MKPDDSTLDAYTAKQVRKHAELLLLKAEAVGRFPTPVKDLVTASKLEIARENALDSVFLGGLYRRLPNSLKLVPDRLKRAIGKVIGLLDREDRTIHLDKDMHPKRIPFVTIHEIGHDSLPWQRSTFDVLEDSDTELEPDTQDKFEREANCFASDVLFQLDRFTKEALEFKFGIGVPIELSKRYGTSIYSSIRRYVTTNDSTCALLIYNYQKNDLNAAPKLVLRRPFVSTAFSNRFGSVNWPTACAQDSFFFINKPKNKFTAPTPCHLTDVNGTRVDCLVEAFDNSYQVFYLIYPLNSMSKRVFATSW